MNEENGKDPLTHAASTEGPILVVQREEVKKTIGKMKGEKAGGCSVLTIDMIKVLDELGNEIVFSLQKTI